VYAVNDTDEPWETSAVLRRVWTGGGEIKRAGVPISVPPRSAIACASCSQVLGNPADPRQEALVLDPAGLDHSARDVWLYVPDRLLIEPRPRWTAQIGRVDDDSVTVIIAAETVLRDLVIQADRIEPHATVDDQVRTVLPGEQVTFRIKTNARPGPSLFAGSPVVWCAGLVTRAEP
jgi:beta-mannosidase